MKLNVQAASWAVGFVSAFSYVICAASVAVAPGTTSRFFSYVLHIDLTSLPRTITWMSFFGGIVCFSIVMGSLAGLAAWAYNRLAYERPRPSTP